METKEQDEKTEVLKVKITVSKMFRDKFDNSVLYKAGDELEFEIGRADDVVSRGLAEYADPVG